MQGCSGSARSVWVVLHRKAQPPSVQSERSYESDPSVERETGSEVLNGEQKTGGSTPRSGGLERVERVARPV